VSRILIRRVTLGLSPTWVSVLVQRGRISAIDSVAALDALSRTVPTLEGRGGVLVPGLRDHHLHLGAILRAARSLRFPMGSLDSRVCREWRQQDVSEAGWLVAFGMDHHHDVDHTLSQLDEIPKPVIVVHQTGHAALVNSAGARRLGLAGRKLPNARGLWRQALGSVEDPSFDSQQLASIRDELLAEGVTSLQDATPYPAAAAAHCARLAAALYPLKVDYMADPLSPLQSGTYAKTLEPLQDRRYKPALPPAVHAITPPEIVAAAERVSGRISRIEHAAVCPPEVANLIDPSTTAVCLNPGFMLSRPWALTALRRTGEAEFFQPAAGLVRRGVQIHVGSDAPVSPPGVWLGIRALVRRPDNSALPGDSLSLHSAISAASGNPGMMNSPDSWLGQKADLALLDRTALARVGDSPVVRHTLIEGRVVYTAQSAIEEAPGG
jgi:predicted amidohydrolase YtcJ